MLAAVQLMRKMTACHEKLLAFPDSETPPQGRALLRSMVNGPYLSHHARSVGILKKTSLRKRIATLHGRGDTADYTLVGIAGRYVPSATIDIAR